jgi:hypothetical protein
LNHWFINSIITIEMKKYFFIGTILLLLSFKLFSEDIPSQVINAFSTGNASLLVQNFNSTIELTLFDKEEIYSKTQAEMILRDFFTKHKPTQFKIIHQGGKENSKYAIGNLVCGSESFRITFLLKSEGNNLFIQQLRIENDYVE